MQNLPAPHPFFPFDIGKYRISSRNRARVLKKHGKKHALLIVIYNNLFDIQHLVKERRRTLRLPDAAQLGGIAICRAPIRKAGKRNRQEQILYSRLPRLFFSFFSCQ